MAIVKVDRESLYEAIEKRRGSRGISKRQIAAELGIPPGTLTRLKDGKGMSEDTFVTLMKWLGADESIRPFLTSEQGRQVDTPEEVDEAEEQEWSGGSSSLTANIFSDN